MVYSITIEKRSSKLAAASASGSGSGSAASKPSAFPVTLEFSLPPTLLELKRAIQAHSKHLTPVRQRLTTAGETRKVLVDNKASLDSYVPTGGTLVLKDLGPQVGWRTVFVTEYAGPLLIHPLLFWYLPRLWGPYAYSQLQWIALGLVLLHYAKREYETILVHRFSADTMPLFNLFKNSSHYWGLSGVFLALGVYGPGKSATSLDGGLRGDGSYWVYGWALAMVFSEVGNLVCHVMLSNLRPPGTRIRKVPRGFAFELVSCPNYLFETLSWASFSFMTLSPAAVIFTLVSTAQMLVWAKKKHANYRKEFPDYPRGRKAMFPFLV